MPGAEIEGVSAYGSVSAAANRKGGVGKSTVAVMLTHALSVHGGKRVLVIDLDSQCNASLILLGGQGWNEVGTTQLALYALGSMVGSGIYGLIGKAAGQAGTAVWLSFIVALFAALLTSLSYASLGSLYPRAGGAAYVTERAFGIPVLSFTIGLALIASGLTSVATQSKIFAAILADVTGLAALPPTAIAAGFLLILGGIVFRGIRESMWVNVLCTLLEVSGLLLVIASGFSYWGTVDYFETPPDRADSTLLVIVLQASVLAFFAFIGFEDAINVAEECKNPERTIPAGILIATLTAAVLYVAVAITSVSVVPWQALAAAPSPLRRSAAHRAFHPG